MPALSGKYRLIIKCGGFSCKGTLAIKRNHGLENHGTIVKIDTPI